MYKILNQEYLDKMRIKAKIEPGGILYSPKNQLTSKIYNVKEIKELFKNDCIDLTNTKEAYRFSCTYKIDTSVMKKYKKQLDWRTLQTNQTLTEEQILKFWDYIDIKQELRNNLTISMNFIEKYCLNEEENYKNLDLKRPDLPDEWIYKNRERLQYGIGLVSTMFFNVNTSRQLPEYILFAVTESRLKNEIKGVSISKDFCQYQALTDEFLERYRDRLDFVDIFNHNYVIKYDDEVKEKYKKEYDRDKKKYYDDIANFNIANFKKKYNCIWCGKKYNQI